MDINAKVFAAFQSENKEQLEAIRAIMGKTPKSGDDAFNEALRLAHTMKAGARVCGLEGIQELAHRLETLFTHIRDSSVAADGEASVVITNSLDAIEDAMASASKGEPMADMTMALGSIDRLLQPSAAAPARRGLHGRARGKECCWPFKANSRNTSRASARRWKRRAIAS